MTKDYDIVVFGATGFTGARVLKYLVESKPRRKAAIAGRKRAKLEAVLAEFGSSAPDVAIMDGVDINDPASVLKMAQSARLVMNCVGPYRFYGEPVVHACVVAGTDYLDVCGEPEFMEAMQVKYGAAAKEAQCFVTSAMGFDTVPADVGATLACTAMQDMGLQPHTVDSFLFLDWGPAGSCGHFATLESAVHGFRHVASLKATRREAKAAGLNPPPQIDGPKPRQMQACEYIPTLGYAIPFPGADASVVRRTMSARGGAGLPAAHYLASFVIRKRWNLWMLMLFGGAVQLLARTAIGRALVLRWPKLLTCGAFSKSGPTQEQMDSTSFVMRHYGYAFDAAADSVQYKVTVEVAGPEPGYVATPCIMVEAAQELLDNKELIRGLVEHGGVCTPGQLLLMHGRSYVDRLKGAGIRIKVTPEMSNTP